MTPLWKYALFYRMDLADTSHTGRSAEAWPPAFRKENSGRVPYTNMPGLVSLWNRYGVCALHSHVSLETRSSPGAYPLPGPFGPAVDRPHRGPFQMSGRRPEAPLSEEFRHFRCPFLDTRLPFMPSLSRVRVSQLSILRHAGDYFARRYS